MACPGSDNMNTCRMNTKKAKMNMHVLRDKKFKYIC